MEISTKNIDNELASNLALIILKGFEGVPMKHYLTCLNALVTALVKYAQDLKEQCENISDEDGIEKTILSWLATTDKVTGLNFTKYINEKAL